MNSGIETVVLGGKVKERGQEGRKGRMKQKGGESKHGRVNGNRKGTKPRVTQTPNREIRRMQKVKETERQSKEDDTRKKKVERNQGTKVSNAHREC